MKGPRCGLNMIERTSPRAWHFAQMDESPVSEYQFQRDRAPSAYFSTGFHSSHMHKRQSELHQKNEIHALIISLSINTVISASDLIHFKVAPFEPIQNPLLVCDRVGFESVPRLKPIHSNGETMILRDRLMRIPSSLARKRD